MLNSLFTPLRTVNPVREPLPEPNDIECLWEDAPDFFDEVFPIYEKPIIKHYRLRLSGVSYNGRQEKIGNLVQGQVISLVTEANNAYDQFAVHAYNGIDDIGYLPRGVNREVFDYLMSCHGIRATVDNIIGGGEEYYLGVILDINIFE